MLPLSCENDGRISLKGIISKPSGGIILHQLPSMHKRFTCENQVGFKLSRGCTDSISIVRKSQNTCTPSIGPWHMLHELGWTPNSVALFLPKGVSEEFIPLFRPSYANDRSWVHDNGNLSPKFTMKIRVPQGYSSSSTLWSKWSQKKPCHNMRILESVQTGNCLTHNIRAVMLMKETQINCKYSPTV